MAAPAREEPWTVLRMLSWTQGYFARYGVDSPRLTSEILLAHLLKMQRLDLYLQYDRPLDMRELADFKALIKRRIGGEPVAYIAGTRGFWEHEFKVSPHVLIPRPDTETLVESALAFLGKGNEGLKVLELGVGSGAVIISIACALPGVSCFATDISPDAVNIARENAVHAACENLRFLTGSWFAPFKKQPMFHLVISNPPYIPSGDIEGLQQEVRCFEPRQALDGGSDGLRELARIIGVGGEYLLPGGGLILEMGFDQKEGVRLLAEQSGLYGSVEFVRDLAGHDRVAVLKK